MSAPPAATGANARSHSGYSRWAKSGRYAGRVLPETPADRHRAVAKRFATTVAGVRAEDWGNKTPVAEWTARDVVRHLIDWFPGFLAGGTGIELPDVPSVDVDPLGAWHGRAEAIQTLLDDPQYEGRLLTNPHIGQIPLPQAIDQFYTADVFMHTWDLAVATGQDSILDKDFCTQLLGGMEQMEAVIRSSGLYGARIAVQPEADVQNRLIAFIGRDPLWVLPAHP